MILFILVALYAVAINGSSLTGFDNFSHWARIPKIVLEYNSLKIPANILYYPQTMFSPILYTFTCFFGGYNFTNILVSMWLAYWIIILLPLSHMPFKKVHLLALYSLLITGILLADKANSMNALADTFISIMAASLLGYYFIRGNFKGKYMILFAGIAVFPHIKYAVGYLFAFYILLIMLYDIYSKNKKLSSNEIKFFIASLVSFAANRLLMLSTNSSLSQPNPISTDMLPYDSKSLSYIDIKEPWCDPVGNFLRALSTPVGIAITALFAAIIVIIIIKKIKRKKIHWLFAVSPLILFVLFLGYSYFTFDAETQLLVKNFIKNSLYLKFLNINIIIYLFALCLISAVLYKISPNKPSKKYMLHIIYILGVQILLFELGTMIYYAGIQQRMIFSGNSLIRYHGMVLYAMTFFLCIVIFNGKPFSAARPIFKKASYIVGVILCLLLLIPGVRSIAKNPEVSDEGYRSAIGGYKFYNDLIQEYAKEDERVCLVIDTINIGDWNATKFITVMVGYHTSLSLNNIVVLNTVSDVELQQEAFREYLIQNKMDKVITIGTGSYFYGKYGEIFSISTDEALNGVFQVTYDDSRKVELIHLNPNN
jgi:hypothetical protein